jgi:DNA modification methylase
VLVLDVDEAEAAKLLATLDPLAAMATADADKLEALLREVGTESEPLAAMLAELAEANGILGGNGEVPADAEPRTDRADELRREWGVEPGQLWRLGNHRLLCGDSTKAEDVARVMGGERADCVFTSPPYAVGVDYGGYEDTIENLRTLLPLLSCRWTEVLPPGGFAVVNFGDIVPARDVVEVDEPCEYPMAMEYWPVFHGDGWLLWSRRVWVKPNARVNSLWCIQSNRAATDWEHVWTWKRPGKAVLDRVNGSQFGWVDTTTDVGVEVGKDTHGAGMALSLPCRLIPVHSRIGAIVHEPFSGSGTTLIACEQLGRRCRAVEISPGYVAVALQRFLDATGQRPARG